MDDQKILKDYNQSISTEGFQIMDIYEAYDIEEFLVMVTPRYLCHCSV